MSWDDEDFDSAPVKTTAPAVATAWEEEEEEVLESWDIDEEEVARQKKEAAELVKKQKDELKKKQEEAKLKKAGKIGEADPFEDLDSEVRDELIRQDVIKSDLNNAADLFGGLGVAEDFDVNEHPRERIAKAQAAIAARKAVVPRGEVPLEEQPLFNPTSKQDFEKLRKTVGTALTDLAEGSLMNYSSSLAIDLIRDLVGPLSVENLRKVISTLNLAIRDKERLERQARLKKSGGTASGGAGKKKAKPLVRPNVGGGFKKDDIDLDEGNFDLDDDDFM